MITALSAPTSPGPVGLLSSGVLADDGELAQYPCRGERHAVDYRAAYLAGLFHDVGPVLQLCFTGSDLFGVVVRHAVAHPVLVWVVRIVHCGLPRAMGPRLDNLYRSAHLV